MPLLDIEKFDPSLLSIGKSGRAFKILYNKEPLQFCTSTLYSPFGVRSINKEWSNFTEYSIDCSINSSNTESATTFKTFLESLDAALNELLVKNSDLTKNAEETMVYSPFYRENGEYPKLIKLQVTRDRNGNFDSFVFDQTKSKIKLTDASISTVLTKGKVFKCIVECSKAWCYNGKVGSIWNIIQLKLANQPAPQEQHESNGSSVKYNELLIAD